MAYIFLKRAINTCYCTQISGLLNFTKICLLYNFKLYMQCTLHMYYVQCTMCENWLLYNVKCIPVQYVHKRNWPRDRRRRFLRPCLFLYNVKCIPVQYVHKRNWPRERIGRFLRPCLFLYNVKYTLYNMYIKGTDLEKREEGFSDLVYCCTM